MKTWTRNGDVTREIPQSTASVIADYAIAALFTVGFASFVCWLASVVL